MLNTADHTYTGCISGLHRRSVTTILAEEGYICKAHYREGKQELGTQVHALLHYHDKGIKCRAPEMYARYLPPYQKMLELTGMKIIDSEVEVEDMLLGVSGTLDKLAYIEGRGHGILDAKVSSCGYVFWHSLQTEAYAQALRWHPKYRDIEIKWRGGVVMTPACDIPKLIPHDRENVSKLWQAICIVNADKHRRKVEMEQITEEEGW